MTDICHNTVNSLLTCFGTCTGTVDNGADPNDDIAVMNHMRERLIKGIPVTKFSRSAQPKNVILKCDEDCITLYFIEEGGKKFTDGECDTYNLSECGIRRATDPDPQVKHFAGSKVLRDNLDPNKALEAFILEAPNKITINCKVDNELEADRIIVGLKTCFRKARASSGQ